MKEAPPAPTPADHPLWPVYHRWLMDWGMFRGAGWAEVFWPIWLAGYEQGREDERGKS